VISQERQSSERWLFRTNLATRHATGSIVVFDDAYRAVLVWIALHNREGAIGAKRLDGFRSAIVVVVPNLAHENAARILLNKIDLPVEVAVALDLDDFAAPDSLDEVGFAVAVGVYRDLVFVFADPHHPLVGPAVASAMSDDTVRASVAGEKCES